MSISKEISQQVAYFNDLCDCPGFVGSMSIGKDASYESFCSVFSGIMGVLESFGAVDWRAFKWNV